MFDPVAWKFAVCHELLFDEESAKKRICALREFDARRKLAKEGRLDELPLVANDFDTSDVETTAALDSERRLYPIPLSPSDSAEGGGAVSERAVEDARADAAAQGGKAARAGDLARTDVGDAVESGLNGLRAGSAATPADEDEDLDNSSDDEYPFQADRESGDCMGSLSDEHGASLTQDDYFRNEAQVEGEELPGPRVRSGRTPSVGKTRAAGSVGAVGSRTASSVGAVGSRTASSVGADGSRTASSVGAVGSWAAGSVEAGDASSGIDEEDAADLFTRDDEAEQYGPLSENQLKR